MPCAPVPLPQAGTVHRKRSPGATGRLLSTAALASMLLAATGGAAAQGSALQAMAWLAGRWASESGEAGTVEQWLAPAGGTMLGMARTVKGGRTVAFEFIQLRTLADGTLAYFALPSGQKQATFIASAVGAGSAVFENPQHDFPQRIIYRLLGNDRLHARIEGLRGGVLRGIDDHLRRDPCPTAGTQGAGTQGAGR